LVTLVVILSLIFSGIYAWGILTSLEWAYLDWTLSIYLMIIPISLYLKIRQCGW
jgi:hypothetical protein